MTRLAQEILERVPEGRTVSRAELMNDANYDSIGRVLRRLVEEGKLVRVGRGRYRRSGARGGASSATIGERIGKKVGRSRRNIFLRTDFTDLGSYDAVGRALRRMVDQGDLVQIGYGLYAKAERSPFTGKPAPLVGIRRLATEALTRLGATVAQSGSEKAYNTGRSTQVPTGRTIAVRDRVRRRIGYDGNYVVFERA